MVKRDLISSLNDLVDKDIVEILDGGEDISYRVFVVSQITSLRNFGINVSFRPLYGSDFPEEKMSSADFNLNSLYDYRIRVFDFEEYLGWKYKTFVGRVEHLEVG